MAGRIRTVKPEWLEDEKLAACSDHARLLSIALLLLADDYGRGRAHPRFIASQVWGGQPDDVDADSRARDGLRELVEIGFCVLYESAGQRYFEIRNWAKHQRVDHPGKPRVPAPDLQIREPVATDSRESRESLAPYLRPPTSDHDHDPPPVREGGRPYPDRFGARMRSFEDPHLARLEAAYTPRPSAPGGAAAEFEERAVEGYGGDRKALADAAIANLDAWQRDALMLREPHVRPTLAGYLRKKLDAEPKPPGAASTAVAASGPVTTAEDLERWRLAAEEDHIEKHQHEALEAYRAAETAAGRKPLPLNLWCTGIGATVYTAARERGIAEAARAWAAWLAKRAKAPAARATVPPTPPSPPKPPRGLL